MSCWLRWGIAVFIGSLIGLVNGFISIDAALAAETSPLTLEALQARLEHPVRREGKLTIDLRQVQLDLTADNEAFRDRFYRSLQTKLQTGDTIYRLDLSGAIIRGTFDLQKLSLREPLYGEAFFPLLTAKEQTQLRRDRQRLSQLSQLSRSLLLQPQPTNQGIFLFRGGLNLAQTQFTGPVLATNIFFLNRLTAQGARFTQGIDFSESRFSKAVSFLGSQFQQEARFRSCLFFQRFRIGQSRFQAPVTFQGSEFEAGGSFGQAVFQQGGNWSRTVFRDTADFGKTQWHDSGNFLKSTFEQAVFFTEAQFLAPMNLRQVRFEDAVNLRGAVVQSQLDFGDTAFSPKTRINVSGLDFNTERAALLGSPGKIARVLSVPVLSGNETLLRNLVRNFRGLEQIADANRIEYITERLRLRSLHHQLTGVNLNTASRSRLQAVGFSQTQSDRIITQRETVPFVDPTDMLDLADFDLSTYVKVRDRVIAQPPMSWFRRWQLSWRWLALSALLLTSHYGTSVGLTLGVGIVAIALSSLLFWGVDRWRRWQPTPILPNRFETTWMLGSFAGLLSLGVLILLRLGDTPGWTSLAIALLTLPIPGIFIGLLYRQGRFHDQLTTSYLVEDGSARQLRLLIARLPIMPKFPFFRDRFYPIDWQKRRNWLNYYDFSFNNWFKFGFNDIRLRDEHVPGWVTALVWYQWAIGLAYVTLLLWTFSRTIPGLNLLLYF